MITVGADRKDVKTKSEATASIETVLDSQSKVASSGRSAGPEFGCFQSKDYGGTNFVDASTACNDVNDDVNGYFCLSFSEALSIYDVHEQMGKSENA